MNKKTLVLGASTRAGRFSYLAIKRLVKHGVEVVAVGMREGIDEGVNICTCPVFPDYINTVKL